MPSSSLVEFEVEIRVEVEVGVEDEVDVGVGVEVEVGGWAYLQPCSLLSRVGGWCGEVKNRANLSKVRLKLRLRLAIKISCINRMSYCFALVAQNRVQFLTSCLTGGANGSSTSQDATQVIIVLGLNRFPSMDLITNV